MDLILKEKFAVCYTCCGPTYRESAYRQIKESYSDKQLEEANISKTDLSEYADLLLGRKIKDCLEAQGTCSFQAEL